jgi:hypothetical protein
MNCGEWTQNLHLDLDTENALTEENVTYSVVYKLARRLTGVDHETVGELHGLRTRGTKLAGDDNLATLGTRLHHEAENTVSGTVDTDYQSTLDSDEPGKTHRRTARPPRSL